MLVSGSVENNFSFIGLYNAVYLCFVRDSEYLARSSHDTDF